KNVPKMICIGDLLHLRAGIGDGNKAAAGFLCSHSLLYTLEEILFEDVRLERGTRLAGNNDNGLGEVKPVFECFDLCRVGRIEDEQTRETIKPAKGRSQHFRSEA